MPAIEDLKRIAEIEFSDIVKYTNEIDYKLRVVFINGSFLDAFLSQKLPDRFGFHWETMDKLGTFFRYDNFPDKEWHSLATFPHHFHRGSQNLVEASPFPFEILEGFRAFLEFIREKLKVS